MSFEVKDLCSIIEEYAPLNLKESYDNVGLMIGDSTQEVKSVLMALDCTLDVIEEAIDKKCNMIITHHPLLFRKPSSITNETLQGRKILKLIKNDINVYSSHTNFDSVKGGLNDIIVELLGFPKGKVIESSNKENLNDGIGRIVELNHSLSLDEVCNIVKKQLNLKNIRYCGDEKKEICKIAIINGSGQDYFEKAKESGADCIITGDTSYHYVSDYNEMGIAVIDAGHFGTEWPAVKVAAKMLQNELVERKVNIKIYVSNCNLDPYKTK